MRQLARFGFVERVESDDGRERPWRATATGFAYDPAQLGPADERLQSAVLTTQLRAEEQALLRHLEAREELAKPWRDASVVHTFHLLMTPAELAALQAKLDQAIRPYVALTRDDAPEDAGAVRSWCLRHRHRRQRERSVQRHFEACDARCARLHGFGDDVLAVRRLVPDREIERRGRREPADAVRRRVR